MTTEELKSYSGSLQLLDVRLPDDFEAAHLTGAVSNCVFEVDFVSRLEDSAPHRGMLTVVYGADGESQEAPMALEKLRRAGYSEACLLEGGFAVAAEVMEVMRGLELDEAGSPPHGRYEIDTGESKVGWTGRNLLNKHSGFVAVESGYLEFKEGKLSGGRVILDLTKIDCTDLAGTPVHDVLIDHLMSDDFFDVEKFSTATLEISGAIDSVATARLTMKGQTHPVEIPFLGGLTEDGLPAAQAVLKIDRTKWGVIYGSKNFFKRLAGHLVHDEIDLDVRILTRR